MKLMFCVSTYSPNGKCVFTETMEGLRDLCFQSYAALFVWPKLGTYTYRIHSVRVRLAR